VEAGIVPLSDRIWLITASGMIWRGPPTTQAQVQASVESEIAGTGLPSR